MTRWILRVGEMSLKSRPVRRQFSAALRDGLRRQSLHHGWTIEDLHIEHARVVLTVTGDAEPSLVRAFGVVRSDEAVALDPDPEAVAAAVVDAVPAGDGPGSVSFAVRCRRSGNATEWSSPAFAAAVGAAIGGAHQQLRVDLSNPDWVVDLLLTPEACWWQRRRLAGPGGLPAGVQGAIWGRLDHTDDVLRAWLVLRRGCRVWLESDSDPDLVDLLAAWDPTLVAPSDDARAVRTGPSGTSTGQTWAHLVGSTPQVSSDEVPTVALEPLTGWSAEERSRLLAHVQAPLEHPWRVPGAEDPAVAWIG